MTDRQLFAICASVGVGFIGAVVAGAKLRDLFDRVSEHEKRLTYLEERER